MKPERNEPCPCGSGKKSKKCCGEKKSLGGRGIALLVGALLLIGAIGIVPAFWKEETGPRLPYAPGGGSSARPVAAAPVPGPAPAGQAPPGKVWSAEHGHWHDAPNARSPIQITPVQVGAPSPQPAQQRFNPAPQPTGSVPPGKVWSTEHGHWHDAPR